MKTDKTDILWTIAGIITFALIGILLALGV
jgi:hypothetical protein